MNWDYIAGFFDGEGSIFDRGDSFRIQITQAHFDVLDTIRKFSNIGRIAPITKRKAHWKESWVYYVAPQEDVFKFLKGIEKRVIVKRSQVSAALPQVRQRLHNRQRRRLALRGRITQGRMLRARGFTYREIAERLQTDHGYIRRLILGKRGGRSSIG